MYVYHIAYNVLDYDPAILQLGIQTREMKTYVHTKINVLSSIVNYCQEVETT